MGKNEDKTRNNINAVKKKAVIELFKKTFGNVTACCEAMKMSRRTFYEWLKDDADFRAEIENIQPDDLIVDFAENALIKKIRDGDTTAIIFTLKTKGKKRGYIEKSEIGISTSEDIEAKRKEFFEKIRRNERSDGEV